MTVERVDGAGGQRANQSAGSAAGGPPAAITPSFNTARLFSFQTSVCHVELSPPGHEVGAQQQPRRGTGRTGTRTRPVISTTAFQGIFPGTLGIRAAFQNVSAADFMPAAALD